MQESDIIAYQIRQSFRPGEVSPEEANRIGYEFAERFLKGNHAFIVCTHTDKSHIHNHIYWNSTTLDCTRKFSNFIGSYRAVRKLSDLICAEHRLSVIEKPQKHGLSYNKWLGGHDKLSNRDLLRMAIDAALEKKPKDFDAFLALLKSSGYSVSRKGRLSLRHENQKQSIRLDSLGEGYSKKYLLEHESDIIIHKAARSFDDFSLKKLPTVKSLNEEFAKLLTEKSGIRRLPKTQEQMRELMIHKNAAYLLGLEERKQQIGERQRKRNSDGTSRSHR